MSSVPQAPGQSCSQCGETLDSGELACRHCHALLHAQSLERLAASARGHEQAEDIEEARNDWLKALELLPADSSQAAWIRDNLTRLNSLRAPEPSTKDARYAWAKKLGPLAPIAVLLANGKFLLALFKLKFLLSLGSFVAFYWAIYGAKFGAGCAILILVHEMGHFIEVKRQGLPADLPVFIPGFGAYVRWQAAGVPPDTRALVSLAGPLAGFLGAAVCLFIWQQTGNELFVGLASLTALLNVLNLIPIWALDGGQAMLALGKSERVIIAIAAALVAAALHQPLLLLVGAGAVYRLFTKDLPETPNPTITLYYVLLLAGLGYITTLAPHHAA